MTTAAQKYPPVISLFRTLKNLPSFVKNPIPILDEYFRDAGDTFGLHLDGRNKAILTSNPYLIQHILQKNHRNYRKSPIQVEQLAHFIGKGLLTSDGPYWLQQRRLIQPGFHKTKLAGLINIMLQVTDQFLDDLETKAKDQKNIDIYHEMMELTFTLVAKSLFSTGIEESIISQLGENLTQVQSFIVRQIRQPFLTGWYRISGEKENTRSLPSL